MHVMGFIDRMVSEWGGPRTFLARRKVSLSYPVYAGDTMVGAGRVATVREETRAGHRRGLVDSPRWTTRMVSAAPWLA